jgi:hypothetical protein
MKRLMLDHFRRWSWILVPVAVFEFVFGWFADGSLNQYSVDVSAVFQFALFTGAFLLLFDLQRGIVRTVTALPLTTGQIGRAWWLATVGIPTAASVALFFLGAGMCHIFQPTQVFPAGRLAIASLLILLMQGTGFTLIFNIRPGLYGNGWERARNIIFGTLEGILIGGGIWFFQDVTRNPAKFAILLGVGAVYTVVGWFRAERFVWGRASLRLAALQGNNPRGQHRAPAGYGGIPLLLSTSFVRTLLMGVAIVALMPLFMALGGHMNSWHQVIEAIGGLGIVFPFWFVIFFQLIPALLQLRFLRTLPIPATRLAAMMIAMTILPLVALGALVAGVAGMALGMPTALTVLKSYTLTLAPASLCIFFAVWRGVGMETYALLIFTMVGFQTVPMWLQVVYHSREVPFSLAGLIVAICVLLAFVLTRRALMHSSHTYRVQANPFGNFAWGTGR